MKKITLYSSSSRARKTAVPRPSAHTRLAEGPHSVTDPAQSPAEAPPRGTRWRGFYSRYERPLLFAGAGLFALAVILVHGAMTSTPRAITQKDIDAAVLHTLEQGQLPSAAAKAYEAVRRSVVRVHGIGLPPGMDLDAPRGIGTGVVIVDTGIILTNMHVVVGADRIKVEFSDGLESDAAIIGVRPEHDLAVLQAKTLPDDLPAATLRSTSDLAMGDEVIAVGFPFGIGPSVSAGVVSGLRREYQSEKGERLLTNLIQFDAAVNPGNSGGPLLTTDGQVVGIVTAILNPTGQHVFVGIGFAVPIENAAAAIGISPF
ncbi:MAG: S1C family serine protease [Casimicrobiaceae bacterium]